MDHSTAGPKIPRRVPRAPKSHCARPVPRAGATASPAGSPPRDLRGDRRPESVASAPGPLDRRSPGLRARPAAEVLRRDTRRHPTVIELSAEPRHDPGLEIQRRSSSCCSSRGSDVALAVTSTRVFIGAPGATVTAGGRTSGRPRAGPPFGSRAFRASGQDSRVDGMSGRLAIEALDSRRAPAPTRRGGAPRRGMRHAGPDAHPDGLDCTRGLTGRAPGALPLTDNLRTAHRRHSTPAMGPASGDRAASSTGRIRLTVRPHEPHRRRRPMSGGCRRPRLARPASNCCPTVVGSVHRRRDAAFRRSHRWPGRGDAAAVRGAPHDLGMTGSVEPPRR